MAISIFFEVKDNEVWFWTCILQMKPRQLPEGRKLKLRRIHAGVNVCFVSQQSVLLCPFEEIHSLIVAQTLPVALCK